MQGVVRVGGFDDVCEKPGYHLINAGCASPGLRIKLIHSAVHAGLEETFFRSKIPANERYIDACVRGDVADRGGPVTFRGETPSGSPDERPPRDVRIPTRADQFVIRKRSPAVESL